MDNFSELLKVQKQTLENTKTIKTLLESGNAKDVAAAEAQERYDAFLRPIQEQSAKVEKENIKIQKEIAESVAKTAKLSEEQAEALTHMAQSVKTFETLGDKFEKMKKALSDNFSISKGNLATTLLKGINFGGVFDKKIAQRQFMTQQKELGSKKSSGELKADFEERNRISKDIKKNEEKYDKFKKETGLSDKELAKTKYGSELLGKREELATRFHATDMRAGLVTGLDSAKSESTKANEASDDSETEIENAKQVEKQSDLLQKIADNTSPINDKSKAATPSSKGDEGSGLFGSMLKGVGKGLSTLGKGLKDLGAGAGNGIRSLLFGIAAGIEALGAVVMTGVGAAGLAALAALMLALGKALQWAAPAIEAFGPVLMKLVEVIGGVFIEGIKMIPEILRSIGEVITNVIGAIADSVSQIFDTVTTSIERLAQIDGMGLFKVAGGLLAVSGAMATFAGASVLAGIGNFVGKLLNFGGDSPVDQVIKLGKYGPGVQAAASGLKELSGAMTEFSKMPKNSMDAVNNFPWVKATMFAAAGGKMTVENASVGKVEPSKVQSAPTSAANDVMFASAENRDANRQSVGASSTPIVVNAPTTVSKQTQNNMVQPQVRNYLLGSYYASKLTSPGAHPYAS